MESFLVLCIITLFVILLMQRQRVEQLRRDFREFDTKLSSWSAWGYGINRNTDAVRQDLTELTHRITDLEQRRVPTAAEPQSSETVPLATAAIAPEPVPVATATVTLPTIDLLETIDTEVKTKSEPPPLPTTAAAFSNSVIHQEEPVETTSSVAEPAAPFAPKPETTDEGTNSPNLRRPGLDWESLIGVRLFSWIAGISLLLGAVFFLRYSAESGWLSPPVRMAMGLIAGMLLLAACEWKGQRYRITANALDAAGIGTLYATSFASNAVWQLIPTTISLLLLVLVTVVAVLLAIRRQSLFIALLGLVGGFSAPILLSSGENRPLGLFGYLLLLNLGLAVIGYRQRWPLLLCLSIGLTTLYQWGWLTRFVFDDASQLPIAAGVFLLFPLVWLGFNRLWKRRDPESTPEWVSTVLAYSSSLPLLLALVMAWVPAFGQQYLLLFAYLFVVVVGLLFLDHFRPQDKLGPLALGVTLLVWLTWTLRAYSSDCWPLIDLVLAVFVVLFLGAQLWSEKFGGAVSVTRFTAPALLFLFPLLVGLEPLTATPFVAFGTLLFLFGAIAATALYRQDGYLYYAAVPAVVLAEACWSAKYLNEARLLLGLIIYLVFALAFIAVPLLARRFARPMQPTSLATVVPLLNVGLLLFLSVGPVAQHALWVIGLLLIVLNVGAFIEARAGRLSRMAFASLGLSWLVVALWWSSAIAPERMVLALVVVLSMVLLSVGGLLWIRSSRQADRPDSLLEQGPLLGLVGHLFLLFVASQPQLSNPPWPFFGIVFLLDLALIAASLHVRRALFATAGLALTQLILCVWAVEANTHYVPFLAAEIALLATAVILGLAEGLLPLARRLHLELPPFALGLNVVLLQAQGLLVVFGLLPTPARLPSLLLGQASVLGLLMLSARARAQHWLVLVGWGGACLSELTWAAANFESNHWERLLLLALVPYVLQTFYPVFVSAHSKVKRLPFVVAICGAIGFFAAGYYALESSPLEPYLGGLPLALSLVMAGLLVYLLRIVEPVPPRDIGRLALVAAIALGFVTTAIPLQLKNEWLTVAWALETTALAWLYQRLRHPGLIAASLALATAVVVRLSTNPEVFAYHERSSTPIFNFYLYAYLVSAIALYAASWLLRDPVEPQYPWLQKTGWTQRAFATLLLFVLLNIEIADYYSEGKVIVFRFSSTLAQDLTYTLGWALFAMTLLIAGIVSKGRAARIAALVLLTLTIAKCFLHDLWRLGGLYRVGSFVGLAFCLAGVAILLQRFVLKSHSTEGQS